MTTVAVLGASGYAGAEFLRLAHLHPDLKIAAAFADTQAGTAVRELYPNLSSAYPDLVFQPFDADLARSCDVVVSGLPHRCVGRDRGRARRRPRGARPRRRLPAEGRPLYPQWYGEATPAPELLDRLRLRPARAASATDISAARRRRRAGLLPDDGHPGPRPPRAAPGWSSPTGIIVDAASGVSGAGRPPKPNTTFCAVDEDFTAYGLLNHRHTPEIEQEHRGTHGPVHAAPGPDEPGHPRHLLPPAGRAAVHRRAAGDPHRGLRRRAVRRRRPTAAVHQGHPRAPTAPISPPASTPAPDLVVAIARSTTS